jgi:hypothetical protein
MLTRNLSLHVRTLILPQKIGNESPGTFEDRSSVNLKTEITVIEIYSLLKLLAFKRRKKRKIICWHSETRPAWAGFKTAEEGRTKIM